MTKFSIENYRDQIIGLRPVYSATGNNTQILLNNGEIINDQRSLKGVKRAVFRSYAIDFSAQREQLQTRLGRTAILPFYLSPERIFIPLKMRQAVTENDATYGYLDLAYIGRVEGAAPGPCSIILTTGQAVEVFCGRATVVGNQYLGRELKTMLNNREIEKNEEIQAKTAALALVEMLIAIFNRTQRIEDMMKGHFMAAPENYPEIPTGQIIENYGKIHNKVSEGQGKGPP